MRTSTDICLFVSFFISVTCKFYGWWYFNTVYYVCMFLVFTVWRWFCRRLYLLKKTTCVFMLWEGVTVKTLDCLSTSEVQHPQEPARSRSLVVTKVLRSGSRADMQMSGIHSFSTWSAEQALVNNTRARTASFQGKIIKNLDTNKSGQGRDFVNML